MNGKMIVIKTDGSIVTTDLATPPSLEVMQSNVGGYIELVSMLNKYKGERCLAFCNEEGKLDGLPLNHAATELYQSFGVSDFIAGDLLLLQGDQEFLDIC